MRKIVQALLLLCLHGLARGQTEGNCGYYWFDGQEGVPHTSPMFQGSFDVDASALTDGIHTFHYIVANGNGEMSLPIVRYFYKTPKAETSMKGYYWFDEETHPREAILTNGTFEVDASSLSDGFHRFQYQVQQSNGSTSMPMVCFFLKTAQVNDNDELNCICTVDGQLRHIEKLSQQGGIIHWDLDMHDLSDGIHRIQLQTVTMGGAMSSSYTSYFMRVTTPEELGEMRCLYAIDTDAFNTDASVVGTNGNYHFDLDLSELSDGLHHISYMLYNDRGTSTKIQTRFFIKTPLGGNGITLYQYWLNDDDVSDAKTITLPQKVNPLQLMSLLPVESRPFRSSLFQFDMSSGQPKLYAKNTIHLRFYDAAMRFTDAVKDYTDYSVSQDVNVIKELDPGVRETTKWPEENEIKWYQVKAERGDSLRFKLDHAASLQLFAPSGKEIYNVSGSESVKWGGLHAAETGTFYLALHDVTATQGDDISIDYEHIDKYAVLRQDVSLVGNGGCSTITFEGNGFRDLYAVDLYNEHGDSIKHILIGHESDATTSVAFDFTGVALGNYHAKFHFAEEDKVLTNLVTVEEARDIELATTVTYPSLFLRGTSTTYTIKISNKGNMTAYNVPIYTYIQNNSENGIYGIKYNGLDLVPFAEVVSIDVISEKDKGIIQNISDEICDDWQFIRFKVPDDNNMEDSIIIRSNYFFTNIPPNTTKELSISLCGAEDVYVYVTVPPDWKELSYRSSSNKRTNARQLDKQTERNNYCCIREGVECLADFIASRIDVAAIATAIASNFGLSPEIAVVAGFIDCAAGLGNNFIKSYGYLECGSYDTYTAQELYAQGLNVEKSMTGAVMSCVGAYARGNWGTAAGFSGAATSNYGNYGVIMKSILDDIIMPGYGTIKSTYKCVMKFVEPKPGCPPTPPHGGKSSSVISMDPNDIYGYTTESGNHAVKEGLTGVFYRIEFENDPKFATAAAHQVVVTDTLDATKFDLSSYAPTQVKIGEKRAELTGDKNFVTTIDMRPEINAIAQVEGTYDEKKGIAKWHISSLDPMTMEPTDDVMLGVLPVNHNGNGIGEVMFDISLKPDLVHGTEVNNRASIVFDTNEKIMTPYWTNTIDRIAPESHITDVKMLNDSTASVSIEAGDELSGPWRYDVYVQYGEGSAWFLGAKDVPIDKTASVKVYEGINHGFYAVVTDSAGNVEQKQAEREFTFEIFGSQIETNTKVQLAKGWNWMSHNQDTPLLVEAVKPKSQQIISQSAELHKGSQQNWTGYLEELLPTEMYKVQMVEADELLLSGMLFNAAFRSVPLRQGWNWIGYPVANAMSVGEALSKLEAEEGDAIISQDGIAIYSNGHWTGTLSTMYPGIGYMYRSVSDKNLFLNASAQYSARKIRAVGVEQKPTWNTDKRSYPDVMGFIADLYQNESMANCDDYAVGAFCNDECRGIAQISDGHLMMNVYGEKGDVITFRALHRESGEVLNIAEEVPLCSDLFGTIQKPYELHIGNYTGIILTDSYKNSNNTVVYDVQGRKIDKSRMKKGVYVRGRHKIVIK